MRFKFHFFLCRYTWHIFKPIGENYSVTSDASILLKSSQRKTVRTFMFLFLVEKLKSKMAFLIIRNQPKTQEQSNQQKTVPAYAENTS